MYYLNFKKWNNVIQTQHLVQNRQIMTCLAIFTNFIPICNRKLNIKRHSKFTFLLRRDYLYLE